METPKVHCPKCGSQQASGTERFCRACGLSLSGVSELVTSDEDARVQRDRFRSAMRQGLILLLVCLLVSAVLTLLKDFGNVPESVVKLVAFVLLIAAMARIFYPYVVGPRASSRPAAPGSDGADLATNPLVLPSPTRSDAADFTPPPPREFEPASVTERTTRSLDDAAG